MQGTDSAKAGADEDDIEFGCGHDAAVKAKQVGQWNWF